MCPMAADDRKHPGTPPGGGVISNLPRHRPHHRSEKRAARPPANGSGTETSQKQAAPDSAAGETARATSGSGAQRKPRPAQGKRSAAASRAAAGKPGATASRARKTPAERSARERIGATAGAKTRSQDGPRPAPGGAERPGGPPSGAEVVGTVIRAAGELAEIGLNLSSEAVKNALKRLPRP